MRSVGREQVPRAASPAHSTGIADQIVMVVVSVYSLLALVAIEVNAVPARISHLLDIVDDVVCLVFFVDFVISLVKAESRWKYFLTWGWLDLVSSIPAIPALRYARITQNHRGGADDGRRRSLRNDVRRHRILACRLGR